MNIRWFIAASRLIALAIGLGAISTRSLGLGGKLDATGLKRVFYADNWWGIAALLWIVTGLLRAFGGLEKGTEYYVNNWLFLVKMGPFLLIRALEIWPMTTFIRLRRGETIDTSRGPIFARMSTAQAGIVVIMVFAATGVARGIGI
jgi:putative membrane protein